MNDYEKEFDKFMESNGGIYIPVSDSEEDILLTILLDEMKKYIDELRTLNGNLPKVNIYYVDNDSINACAFTSNSQYYIAINKGTVYQLKNIYDLVFNNNKLFDGDLFLKSDQSMYGANFLYYSMIFLVIHEYSHIRFGHCDLIDYLWGTSISELTSNCLIQDGIFRQTLEYDADCCTIVDITRRILILSNLDIEKISNDLGQWMLSCYILFKIFDGGKHGVYEKYDLDDLAKSTHPRPGMRQHYLLASIATLLLQHFETSDVDKIMARIMSYISFFENTLREKVELSTLEMGIIYTQKGSEHLMVISNNWKKVRPMLEPYTHVNLAPFEELILTQKYID